jgi:hypothetical protein
MTDTPVAKAIRNLRWLRRRTYELHGYGERYDRVSRAIERLQSKETALSRGSSPQTNGR